MMIDTTVLTRLSDPDLEAEVARLAGCEREATVTLIAHLAELYGRRLHLRAGFSSLFTYCRVVLALSEHEAYDRMKAAKVARRYPAVLGLLASGRINLTTVRLLSPHLTCRNHQDLIGEASGKSKRQVQELLARRFPRPDVASSIRKLPSATVATAVAVPRSSQAEAEGPVGAGDRNSRDSLSAPAAAVPMAMTVPTSSRPLVEPLAPDRYRVTFTADAETCEMLDFARDLLRHAVPGGEPAEIVKRSVRVLIERLVKEKFAVTARPRAGRPRADDAREPSAEVKRIVFIRDRGRCVYVAPGGRKCGERGFVEFHHLIVYAAGGKPTVENIELRCRAHNGYEAEVFYGPARRHLPVGPAGGGSGDVSVQTRFRSGTTAMTDDWRTPPPHRNGPAPPSC